MDFSEFGIEKLIPKVAAQFDTLAQPTFGTLDTGTETGSTASISLEAVGDPGSSISVNVGDTFEVDVIIDTKGIRVKEYEIVLEFNTNQLTVIDSEQTEPGTQIQFIDSVFDVVENTVSLNDGRVQLRANTSTGIAFEIPGRSVARIRFQSQAEGTSVVEMIADASGSKLINNQDRAIQITVENLTISSTTETTGNTDDDGGNTDNVVPGTDDSTDPTTTGQDGSTPPEIPDTAIEDLANIAPLIFGMFLLIIGIMLSNSRKPKQDE